MFIPTILSRHTQTLQQVHSLLTLIFCEYSCCIVFASMLLTLTVIVYSPIIDNSPDNTTLFCSSILVFIPLYSLCSQRYPLGARYNSGYSFLVTSLCWLSSCFRPCTLSACVLLVCFRVSCKLLLASSAVLRVCSCCTQPQKSATPCQLMVL